MLSRANAGGGMDQMGGCPVGRGRAFILGVAGSDREETIMSSGLAKGW